jgi:DNA-directed RNA polymerase specialized sigma24 family protein
MTTMSSSASEASGSKRALGDPEVRRFLEDFVRRRAPASDVDDLVQTVLVDALASDKVPAEREELRKWLVGIARHKVADFHRKTTRERPTDPPEQEAPPAPIEAREMVQWAEEQAGSTREGAQTLGWMAREGEGEKLESIASEEKVPAARVRQRVSRMRRWMKERWAAELAAVALIAVLLVIAWRLLRDPKELPEARPENPPVPTGEPVTPSPEERAEKLRADALEKCDHADWRGCLDGLDEAKAIDPVGDGAPSVQQARERAQNALDLENAPPIEKGPAPTATPSNVAPPTKAPPTKPSPKTSELDSKFEVEKKVEMQKKLELEKSKSSPAPIQTSTPVAPTSTLPQQQQQEFTPPQSTPQAPMKPKAAPPTFDKGGGKKGGKASSESGTGSKSLK